jgi:hypothetical protein
MFICLLGPVLEESIFSANGMLPFTLITAPPEYSCSGRRKLLPFLFSKFLFT